MDHFVTLKAIPVRFPHRSFEATQGLDQVSRPAHMKHRCGAALLPFADAVIETKQVGKAFWVLQGREGGCLFTNLLWNEQTRASKRDDGEKNKNILISFTHVVLIYSFIMYTMDRVNSF